jgi:glycosyltransferase involved in cell wall biosynthesis
MATCNGGKYLKKQIESILKQLGADDELIISDDSSTDNTAEIVGSFQDRRIQFLGDNAYHNSIFNFENALSHAAGDYIFLADQDDIWHESKVSTVLPLLAQFDLVVSDCAIVDENENVISPSFFQWRNSGPGLLKNILRNSYLGCCMAFRSSLLLLALPFPARIPMHDIWLGALADLKGKVFFCNEKLVYYRRHNANASPTGDKYYYGPISKIRFRYNLVSALIRRCA